MSQLWLLWLTQRFFCAVVLDACAGWQILRNWHGLILVISPLIGSRAVLPWAESREVTNTDTSLPGIHKYHRWWWNILTPFSFKADMKIFYWKLYFTVSSQYADDQNISLCMCLSILMWHSAIGSTVCLPMEDRQECFANFFGEPVWKWSFLQLLLLML